MHEYKTIQVGCKNTNEYEVYLTKNKKSIISPWHEIYPFEDDHIICVNEIPRFSNAKLEISKIKKFNPICQDIKKGKLRYVHNIFPFKGYPWNYGEIPQTWEDYHEVDEFCMAKGDNDPLDVVEIGTGVKEIGEVYKAKVLGLLALIDDGEADYKIIVVDTNNKLAEKLNDIADVETYCPTLLKSTIDWFKDYKLPEGKGENKFGLNGEYQDKEFAMNVIKKAHDNYLRMMVKKNEEFAYTQTGTVTDIPCKFEGTNIEEPADVNEFFFIKR